MHGISTATAGTTTRRSKNPSYSYAQDGTYKAQLQVTDSHAASSKSDPITIAVGNTPPTATITSPASTLTWRVGDAIQFSGSATDQQDGNLPASALSWSLIQHHCPSNCHTHPIQDFQGVASGSFKAPDHEYPSYLELRLTATDSGGASGPRLTSTKSVRLDPKTVVLRFQTKPTGLKLVVGSSQATAPFSRTVIVGSKNTISATSPQTLGGRTYNFRDWSDGGAQTHDIVAPASATTYTATYKR